MAESSEDEWRTELTDYANAQGTKAGMMFYKKNKDELHTVMYEYKLESLLEDTPLSNDIIEETEKWWDDWHSRNPGKGGEVGTLPEFKDRIILARNIEVRRLLTKDGAALADEANADLLSLGDEQNLRRKKGLLKRLKAMMDLQKLIPKRKSGNCLKRFRECLKDGTKTTEDMPVGFPVDDSPGKVPTARVLDDSYISDNTNPSAEQPQPLHDLMMDWYRETQQHQQAGGAADLTNYLRHRRGGKRRRKPVRKTRHRRKPVRKTRRRHRPVRKTRHKQRRTRHKGRRTRHARKSK